MQSIAVITANAMRLAATQYNDSTAFIAILQQNNLIDYLINEPVVVNTTAPAKQGDNAMLLEPTTGIVLGDLIYGSGFGAFGVVTGISQNFAIPTTPFCSCPSRNSAENILPPQGALLSTMINFSQGIDPNDLVQGLDSDVVVGSPMTFVGGAQTAIFFPDTLPANTDGVPT